MEELIDVNTVILPPVSSHNNQVQKVSEQLGNVSLNAEPMLPEKAPETFYSFEFYFKMVKHDITFLAKYIDMFDPKDLPSIIKESLTNDILFAFIKVIKDDFIPNQKIQKSIEILKALSKVPRFKLQVMFLVGDQMKGMAKDQLLYAIQTNLLLEALKDLLEEIKKLGEEVYCEIAKLYQV